MPRTDINRINRECTDKNFKSVYFLHGDESYLTRRAVDTLTGHAVEPAAADFNYERFHGPDMNIERVLTSVATPPMMATRRVVLIQEVDRDLAESFGLDKPMGALVAQVQSGSPAAEAGLQPGDVIIAFNGREIQRSAQLPKWVGALKAGTEAEMTVVRDGDEKTLEVTVGELPDNPQAGMAGQPDQDQGESDKLGLEVRAASAAELARVKADHGVVITGVQDGPAARAGLSSGDLLVSLNGKPVDSLDAYREIAADLPDEGTVPALVNRDGNARFVAIKL